MTLDLKQIFYEAIKNKASDVHLVAGQPPTLRVDGVLKRLENQPLLEANQIVEMVTKILTEKERDEIFQKKESDFSYQIENLARFRINLFWEKGNLSLSARVIWPHLPTMEEIQMPPIAYELANKKDGLIIVTGPAGCGKSTTLAAFINYINQNRSCRIITLEDPIEFVFPSQKSIIVQRELGRDMISFNEALKHVLRQDPNVIMVGEMRDLETFALTLTLAETGHLVLATLHTPNAAQTIDRIVDVFPSHQQTQIRLQLALALRAIIAQQLLPKMGGGRIASREILINIPAIATLIRENKIAQIKSVIQTSGKYGMFTMEQNLRELYKKNLISKETAIAHASYPEEIITELS
jgi:twitching motility protein PilT